jgi:chromate transporter
MAVPTQARRAAIANGRALAHVFPPAAIASGQCHVNESAPRPSLAALFLVFLRIGLLSFGGGVTGWVYREVVSKRGWIGEDEFMSGLAMSQILPGTNIGNLSIYLGQRLRGGIGAIAALFGLLTGPFFAVIALGAFYSTLKELRFSEAAMDGVAASAIGMLLIIVGRGTQRMATEPVALAALVATFVAVGLLHWSLPLSVLVIGTASVLFAWLGTQPHEG